MKLLIHHLLGETRTAVLAALLLRPEQSLHLHALVRMTGASAGSLHRELKALVEYGVLRRTVIGRQVFYQADPGCAVLSDLTGLLRKTAGLADVLRSALMPLTEKIVAAFVYGSMAKGNVHSHSDVDIMIIGTLGFADAVLALEPAQTAMRREINPTVLSPVQFARKRGQRDGFVSQVWKEPKVWVIGSADELG